MEPRPAVTQPLRVAIIGTAARSDYLYGPLLRGLPREVELVAVWGRNPDSARRLGTSLGVPWYTDLDRLRRETAPQIGIVSVAYGANGEVGLMAVDAGLHVLLETPIAMVSVSPRRGRTIQLQDIQATPQRDTDPQQKRNQFIH